MNGRKYVAILLRKDLDKIINLGCIIEDKPRNNIRKDRSLK